MLLGGTREIFLEFHRLRLQFLDKFIVDSALHSGESMVEIFVPLIITTDHRDRREAQESLNHGEVHSKCLYTYKIFTTMFLGFSDTASLRIFAWLIDDWIIIQAVVKSSAYV